MQKGICISDSRSEVIAIWLSSSSAERRSIQQSGTGGITVNGKTQKTVCEADGEFVMFTGTAVATQNFNAIQVLVGSPEGYYLVTDIKVC